MKKIDLSMFPTWLSKLAIDDITRRFSRDDLRHFMLEPDNQLILLKSSVNDYLYGRLQYQLNQSIRRALLTQLEEVETGTQEYRELTEYHDFVMDGAIKAQP